MRVAVVGQGYVGITAATGLAAVGHQVVGVERDPARLRVLRAGGCPIYEPGMPELLATTVASGRLTFASRLSDSDPPDAVLITVASPSAASGQADVSQVEAALVEALELPSRPGAIVVKSSIPPGTSAGWLAGFGGRHGMRDRFVHSPEFLSQGTALADWRDPARIVVGLWNDALTAILRDLFRNTGSPWVTTTPANAELIKYTSNAFLATKISFANEIADLCDAVGGDVGAVVEGIGHDPRIGDRFWRPGIGFGDSCLPKDVRAIIHCGTTRGRPMRLLRAVDEVNRTRGRSAVERIRRLLGEVPQPTVAVLGLAYEPISDDMREAPSRDIVAQLVKLDYRVRMWDPILDAEQVAQLFPGATPCPSFAEAAEGAHAALVLTEYPELIRADWTALLGALREPRLLFDAKNCLDPAAISATGALYRGVGRLARANGARPPRDVAGRPGETISAKEPIMPDTGVLRTVRDVVTDTARAHGWSGDDVIPDTQNLLDGGPRLDSLALADLLVRIEQRFGIVIDESVLDPSDVGSIAGLAGMVAARLGTDSE